LSLLHLLERLRIVRTRRRARFALVGTVGPAIKPSQSKWRTVVLDSARYGIELWIFEEGPMAVRFQRNVGMLLLGIWLLLTGLAGLVSLGLPYPLMAVLALLAGILILAGR
jgi:hypothetical protein